MSFCGHCGFQLAPDDTRCPRCGAAVEPEEVVAHTPTNLYPADDATVESSSYQPGRQSQYEDQITNAPPTAPGPQKLVLGPSRYGYSAEAANEETSMMNAPVYQGSGTSYPDYPPQTMPPQTAYPTYGGGGAAYPEQYAPEPAKPRKKSRTAGLVFILLGILLVLGALVLFAMQHGIIGKPGLTQSGDATSTGVVSTPIGEAESVVQRYYASVSKRDYTTAYHLWKNNTQQFSDFQNGYRYTKSASVTFGTAQTQANNSMYLPVTITATEIVAATQKTRQSVYTGYYVVQKQANGTWLIVSGDLRAA